MLIKEERIDFLTRGFSINLERGERSIFKSLSKLGKVQCLSCQDATRFHIKGSALTLVLKLRFGACWRWPIASVRLT